MEKRFCKKHEIEILNEDDNKGKFYCGKCDKAIAASRTYVRSYADSKISHHNMGGSSVGASNLNDPYGTHKRISNKIIYMLKENFSYGNERYAVLESVKQTLFVEDIEKFFVKKGRLNS